MGNTFSLDAGRSVCVQGRITRCWPGLLCAGSPAGSCRMPQLWQMPRPAPAFEAPGHHPTNGQQQGATASKPSPTAEQQRSPGGQDPSPSLTWGRSGPRGKITPVPRGRAGPQQSENHPVSAERRGRSGEVFLGRSRWGSCFLPGGGTSPPKRTPRPRGRHIPFRVLPPGLARLQPGWQRTGSTLQLHGRAVQKTPKNTNKISIL